MADLPSIQGVFSSNTPPSVFQLAQFRRRLTPDPRLSLVHCADGVNVSSHPTHSRTPTATTDDRQCEAALGTDYLVPLCRWHSGKGQGTVTSPRARLALSPPQYAQAPTLQRLELAQRYLSHLTLTSNTTTPITLNTPPSLVPIILHFYPIHIIWIYVALHLDFVTQPQSCRSGRNIRLERRR